MRVSQEKLWAGTENSLNAALEADEAIGQRMAAGQAPDEDEDGTPYLLDINDGLATISIKGPLNNDSGIWNQLFGMTGYPDIRDAVVAAAQDDNVQAILLDIDSGGGAVSGVEDLAKLIRMVNDKIKPVTAYTDGTMASAAYWLGSAAGSVYAGKTAVVGSIGVICTHMERSQALKDAGIGVTVVRSGKYKALANGVEKLTAEGKAQLQALVGATNTVFVENISTFRSKSAEYVEENMGQGKEFIGQPAVDIGLVDGITSFDVLISAVKNKFIDSSNKFMDNRGKAGNGFAGVSTSSLQGATEMGKRALTEQDIAAIAAGAAVTAQVEVETSVEASVDTAVDTDAAEQVGVEAEAQADAGSESVSTEVQNVDTMHATVQLLNEQLATKDNMLIEARVSLARVEGQLAEAQATHQPLVDIATKAVANMAVALGGSASTVEGMSASLIVAEYSRLATQFQSKFPVGGVVAVTNNAEASKTQLDPRHKARVNAVRPQ